MGFSARNRASQSISFPAEDKSQRKRLENSCSNDLVDFTSNDNRRVVRYLLADEVL